MTLICFECSAPITAASKTGRCRGCAGRHTAANPDVLAKRGVTIRAMHKDPAFAERFSRSMRDSRAIVMARPGFREKMSLMGKTQGAKNVVHCHTPEAKARKRAALVPWCPPELLDLNTAMRKQGLRQAERRRIIEEMTPGTVAHARLLIANTNLAMRLKQEREKAQAY